MTAFEAGCGRVFSKSILMKNLLKLYTKQGVVVRSQESGEARRTEENLGEAKRTQESNESGVEERQESTQSGSPSFKSDRRLVT